MKSFKKYISAFVFCFLFTAFCLSTSASAQKNYHNIDETGAEQTSDETTSKKAKSYTVTSIQKCYSLLSREDVLDIQQNYIKPYKECQRRVALELKKKQKEKIKTDAKKKSSLKAQHGFYRVQKKRTPTPETPDNKPSP